MRLSRPLTRRSALLGLAGLGVAVGAGGCASVQRLLDDAGPTVPLEELSTPEALLATKPVVVDWAALGPGPDHGCGLAFITAQGFTRTGHVVTDAGVGLIDLPVSADAVVLWNLGGGADGETRLLAAHPAGNALGYDILRSTDLVSWESEPLDATVAAPMAAAGDGVVIGMRDGRAFPVRRIAADGTVSELGALPVPETGVWAPRSVAVKDAVIVVLVDRTDGDRNASHTVRSADGGTTWQAPLCLEDGPVGGKDVAGSAPVAGAISVHAGRFVVPGTMHADFDVYKDIGAIDYPVAWSSEDGGEFGVEQIPPPVWGTEGWYIKDDGEHTFSADDPCLLYDYTLGSAVVTADGATLSVSYAVDDSYASFTRKDDGTWSAEWLEIWARQELSEVVSVGDEACAIGSSKVLLRVDGVPAFTTALSTAAMRSLIGREPGAGDGALALLRSDERERAARDGFSSGNWTTWTEGSLVTAEGSGIAAVEDLPIDVNDLLYSVVRSTDDGLQVLGGTREGVTGTRDGGVAFSRQGDEWVDVGGLPDGGAIDFSTLVSVDGTYYLGGTYSHPDGEGYVDGYEGMVWRSDDGAAWTAIGEFPKSSSVALLFVDAGELHAIVSQGGSDSGMAHSVLSGEEWTGAAADGLPEDLTVHSSYVLGGETRLVGFSEGMWAEWAWRDGRFTRTYLSDETQRRTSVLALDDDVLLATGYVSLPAVGHGMAVWASRDGGRTWRATLLPHLVGEDRAAKLIRQGEDVIVLAVLPEGPRGYVVRDAARAIRSST